MVGGFGRAQAPPAEPVVSIIPRQRPELPVNAGDVSDVHLRVDASLVLVPLHAATLLGTSVTNLEEANFRIFEDGVEQKISYFAKEDVPLSVGLVFDASGSMANKIRKAAGAAAAFFKTAGFTPIASEAHRTTYLDLSRDCPSWSSRSHMCYLTAARKTEQRQEIPKAPPQIPTQLANAVPQHYPSAHIIRRQNLGSDKALTIALRFERYPGKMERVGIGAEDVRGLELVDGKRTVEEIARLLDSQSPPQAVTDTIHAFTRYFERGLLFWRA